MEVADMDLHLMQSFMGEFINVYDKQFDELVSCISKIKQLDDGILKMHWSGEGRDAFTAKINEFVDSFESVKNMIKTTEKAIATLDGDTERLVILCAAIKMIYI
jgi:hypothetical protein